MAREPVDLTARQIEVLELLAKGLRYSEVAELLTISARQVQRHAAQAVDRAGVANLCQLVAIAIEHDVI